MLKTRFAVLLVIVSALVLPATPASAQDVGPLSASKMQKLQAVPVKILEETPKPVPPKRQPDCDAFTFAPDIKPTTNEADLVTIAECLVQLKDILEKAEKQDSSAELNRDIIQARIAYKRLKKWIPDRPVVKSGTANENGSSDGSTDGSAQARRRPESTGNGSPSPAPKYWSDLKRAESDVATQLPLTLKKHDLFATFAAVLVTGATLTDAGQPEKEGESAAVAAEGEKTTQGASKDAQALGTIIWQSRHFGDESIRTVDWSVGGRIGIQPVLNLVTATPPADAPEGTPPVVGAVHQNAFAWTFGVQMHKPLRGINSEIGWFGSTGSSTLSSLPKAVDKGEGSFVAFPVDYGAQQTAWLWETGLTFNIFDNPLEQIHAEKGTLSPQFQALIAVRRDERFRGSVFDDYKNPTGRLLFRLTLDAIRVFDRRQFGETSKPFGFGFVVEHERSLATTGTRVPSATRFVLRGDINLLKALSGGTDEKKADEDKSGGDAGDDK